MERLERYKKKKKLKKELEMKNKKPNFWLGTANRDVKYAHIPDPPSSCSKSHQKDVLASRAYSKRKENLESRSKVKDNQNSHSSQM